MQKYKKKKKAFLLNFEATRIILREKNLIT